MGLARGTHQAGASILDRDQELEVLVNFLLQSIVELRSNFDQVERRLWEGAVETLGAWVAWGGAQPLFLQILLGLVLFLVLYTAASVAFFAVVLGAAWLMRSIGRQRQGLVAADRPVPAAADSPLTSWIVHAAGAMLILWLVAQSLLS